jgi:hypothetical protein
MATNLQTTTMFKVKLEIKENEMGGACGLYGRGEKSAPGFGR